MKNLSVLFIGVIFLLCACASNPDTPYMAPKPEPETTSANSEPEEIAEPLAESILPSYVEGLAGKLAGELSLDKAGGEAAVRAAYKYMVENIHFADPVGLDVWRYASGESSAIPFLENRSISPFLFQIGSCEDFAAATVMLLKAAGFEAEYVAGYTLSVDMVYVDHAWAVVRLGGEWYHIDPQLEQNVLKNNRLTYRYYLKSDEYMLTDHRWGENLIDFWDDITEAEKANIRMNYTPPVCPESYPAVAAETAHKPLKPDMAAIQAKIDAIKGQSELLLPIELNVEPPVLTAAHHVTPPLMQVMPYGQSFLRGEKARLYNYLITRLQSGIYQDEYELPPSLSDIEALKVAATLQADHPIYDWVGFSTYALENKRFIAYSLKEGLDREPVSEQTSRAVSAAREILAKLPGNATQFEKALYIHDYLDETLQYDKTMKSKNSGNIYGALVENLAYCDGFAKSFHFLCREAGLESVYIKGTSARGIEHAWNAVRVDGLWYYADVTWDRPLREGDKVYHDYFMVSLAEMEREHIPMQSQYPSLPQSGEEQAGYYERMGYFVKDGQDLTAALAQAFYKQLEDAGAEYPNMAEPVFLEVKALGGEENYLKAKEHFIKNVFNILKQMEILSMERGGNFQVLADASVKCNFNDTTRLLTFYPKVRRLKEEK